jgi:hypothetical protein
MKNMFAFSKLILSVGLISAFLPACSHVESKKPLTNQKEIGSAAIRKMAGCFLVDYSYVETEALKKGYKKDPRVYDVNKVKSVKEWIYAEDIYPDRLRLQHILFAADANGKMIKGSELKHQAEDWDYNAKFRYDYTGPSQWKLVVPEPNVWTRRITNLDDGLRYQCSGSWKTDAAYPDFSCENYAPIPGRETRDMQRKDYNTLQRSTRLVVYGDNWLERQENIKMLDKGDKKTPIVKEVGKNWYVRLPASECSAAQAFVESRKDFWVLLRQSWDEVFKKEKAFSEKSLKPPRYAKMMEIEDGYLDKDLKNPVIRKQAQSEIIKLIQEYRN